MVGTIWRGGGYDLVGWWPKERGGHTRRTALALIIISGPLAKATGPVHGSSWSDEHWLTDVHVLRWRQLGFQLALSPEERDISLLSHMRYLENI